MAKSDYICCDKCDGKVVYDGDWEIRDGAERGACEIGALCQSCSETHRLAVVEKGKPEGYG